jgi:hypothetical protein
MKRLFQSERGAAAAEMAMVAPLLIGLLFSSVEMGNYFWNEHVVVKAVRDGARFAARQQMSSYYTSAGGCVDPEATLTTKIRNLVRTGTAADGGAPRLASWTEPGTITIEIDCRAEAGGESLTGIYSGMAYDGDAVGAPVVKITAKVPYDSLFGLELVSDYGLQAVQEATVVGL